MKNVENVELTNNGSIARTFSAKGSEGVTTYTLHAGEAGTGAINLKDLAAAGITSTWTACRKAPRTCSSPPAR